MAAQLRHQRRLAVDCGHRRHRYGLARLLRPVDVQRPCPRKEDGSEQEDSVGIRRWKETGQKEQKGQRTAKGQV
jgi:hypothetical protein